MKKIISVLMVAVALMMAAPAQAQLIKFGVKGGMNFSELDFDKKSLGEVNESSTGFFIGPMAEFTLPIIGLGIDGALMYSQRGKDEAKQQGIEIPVNLKYTIGLGSMFGIYLAAGPDFFFNFKDIDVENIEAKINKISLMWLYLLAYEFSTRIICRLCAAQIAFFFLSLFITTSSEKCSFPSNSIAKTGILCLPIRSYTTKSNLPM